MVLYAKNVMRFMAIVFTPPFQLTNVFQCYFKFLEAGRCNSSHLKGIYVGLGIPYRTQFVGNNQLKSRLIQLHLVFPLPDSFQKRLFPCAIVLKNRGDIVEQKLGSYLYLAGE